MTQQRPSASFSATLRVHLEDRPGAFADVAARDRRRRRQPRRDRPRAGRAGQEGARHHRRRGERRPSRGRSSPRCTALAGVEVEHVSDRTFLLHLGGKIEMALEVAAEDTGRPLDGLHAGRRPRLPRDRRGPEQGLEPHDQAELGGGRQRRHGGARARRHRPGGGDAGDGGQGDALQGVRRPSTPGRSASPPRTPTRSSPTVAAIAPGFGGINLEDISAPRCFEIEQRLQELLDIPVFHDDQHGTAIVVTAALLNALRLVGKAPGEVKVVLTGVGAAGVATTDMLLSLGVARRSSAATGRARSTAAGRSSAVEVGLCRADEPASGFSGSLDEALAGADVFIGLSGPGAGQRAPASRRWPTTRSSSRWPTRPPRSAGGDRGHGRRDRHRTLRLPEPDQQRAGVPRECSAARSTCAPRRSTRR